MRKYLIVLGDVNVFSIFGTRDENVKAKLKCVKFIFIEYYSHNIYIFWRATHKVRILSNKLTLEVRMKTFLSTVWIISPAIG